MDVEARTKFVRLSPSKARGLARKVSGLTAAEALRLTDFSARKAGGQIAKTLKSAIANAENNARLSADELRVKEVTVEEGPKMKRFWPRARGGVSPVIKRTCHIRIVLTDGAEASA